MRDDLTLTRLTSHVVAAYVDWNAIAPAEIASLIDSVHAGFRSIAEPVSEPISDAPRATQANIRRSITPDSLVSFEDGKPYKLLKRHLGARGLTPAEYRAKWGLPADYPMVAANYAAERSAISKAFWFGRKKPGAPAVAPAPKVEAAKPRIKGKLSLFGRRPKSDS